MFNIRKANVVFGSDKEVCIINAKLADQDLEALMALGRGIMYSSVPGMALKYRLSNRVMLGLWCD